MELTFHNWKIETGKWEARQYDNGVWELLLTGDLPDGWAWQALISQGDKLDIIDLAVSEKGVSATLTAENLALTGYYTIQIRGTNGGQVRHTNLVQVYVPRSLSGDATWPEIPTEFSQMENRIRALAEHPPIPGDGYWMIWDMDAGMYQKSNFRLTVDPVEKDAGMTEPVGRDEDGKLWTAPGGAISVTADAIEKALGYTPADKKAIPTALPSPHALTFTGAVTGSYDGSQDVEVETPGGGGSEKPLSLIASYDFTDNTTSVFEETGLDNLTELIFLSTNVTNATTTPSGLTLRINDIDIAAALVPSFKQGAHTGESGEPWEVCRYNGVFWECLLCNDKSGHSAVSAAKSIATMNNHAIRNVGPATKIYLYVPNPIYKPVTGTLEVWGR